jgi:RNA polymerase sigma-70 factor (ECF subfamily)
VDSWESSLPKREAEAAAGPEQLACTEMSGGEAPDAPTIEAELRRLHEEHAEAIYAFARMYAGDAEMAEEALQEAYHRYLVARSNGNRILNPRAWMLRVIQNLVIDWKKAQSREEQLEDRVVSTTPEYLEENSEKYNLVLSKTSKILAPREQEVLELRLKGLRYVDVAETLGIGEGTVSTLLSRAFRKLRRFRWNNPE